MTRYFCVDKAKKRLGYKPIVGLKDGLKRVVDDRVSRRNTVLSANGDPDKRQ
jgi:sterol-4alpha-carboxylate 3-dehydrogenase (decarboxylating)